MDIKKEVETAIGLVGAEYAYAKDFQKALLDLEQEPLSKTQRELRKAH